MWYYIRKKKKKKGSKQKQFWWGQFHTGTFTVWIHTIAVLCEMKM